MKEILSERLPLALAGFSVIVAIAGCGGEEVRQNKPDFLKSANAICSRAAAEQVQRARRFPRGQIARPDSEAVMAFFVPPLKKEVRRLEALEPPQGTKGEILMVLNAIESGLYDVKVDYVDLYFKETDPFREANRLALKSGLDACAETSHAVIKPTAAKAP